MSAQDLPEPVYLGEVHLLRLLPGDVGVIKCSHRLTALQVQRIKEAWREHFPDNDVLVLDAGTDVGVISCEPPA